jgi:polyhydroxybutyrate depolymerase
VIAFHGINDPIIPYEGDQYNPHVNEWVIAWAERNGCELEPVVDNSLDEVTKETWGNCDGNTTVILYSISDAGHTWPGSSMQMVAGGSTQAVNATDLIWEFFENHPKDQ